MLGRCEPLGSVVASGALHLRCQEGRHITTPTTVQTGCQSITRQMQEAVGSHVQAASYASAYHTVNNNFSPPQTVCFLQVKMLQRWVML